MAQPAPAPAPRPRLPRRLIVLGGVMSTLVVGAVILIVASYRQVNQSIQVSQTSSDRLPSLSGLRNEILRLNARTMTEMGEDLPNYAAIDAQRAVVGERLAAVKAMAVVDPAYQTALESVDLMLQTFDTEMGVLRQKSIFEARDPVVIFELERSFAQAEGDLDILYQTEEASFFQATNASFTTLRNVQAVLIGTSILILALGVVLLFTLRRSAQAAIGQAYDRLQVAAEVGRAASSILDLNELFSNSLNLIRERFGYYHAAIFLLDERGEYAVLREATGEAGRLLKARGFRLAIDSQSVVGFVARERQPRSVLDVAQDPLYLQEALLPETRSELALPLVVGSRLLGVLDVQSVVPRAFQEVDLSVLQTLADQMAVAIANATQYGREQARAEQLAALASASAEFGSPHLGLDGLLDLINARALELFHAAGATLWLSAGPDELELRSAAGAGPSPAGQRVRRNAGLFGQVFASGSLLRVDDAGQGNAPADMPFQAALAVPLLSQAQAVGVLALTHTQPGRRFLAQDENLAQLFATAAAAAITNARLFAETQRRAAQLAVSAEVARVASSLHDMEALLQTAVELISQRFGFYHAGLFLVDDRREWAVLQAASSPGGQRMLARGHRLRIGQQGIVGFVTGTGQPRIALDVGADAVHFQNPDLPETHSEMAVPLKTHSEVIGALDVQSEQADAFGAEDAAVLQTLADQLGVAIENARLFEATQRHLQELQALQREARQGLAALGGAFSYRYDGVNVRRLEHPTAEPPAGAGPIQIPIQAGGTTLGQVHLKPADAGWSADDEAFAQTIVERLALALENARLFETTRASLAETARLYRATRDIAAAESQEQIARAVIEHGLEPHYARFGLALLDFDAEQRPSAAHFLADREGRSGAPEADGRTLRTDELPLLAGLQADAPVLLPDLAQAEVDADSRRYLQALGLRAAALIPLAAGAQLLGVLRVGVREPHAFSDEEVRTLQALADQAAVALQNIRLLRETQQRLADLATINRLSQAVASQLDLDVLLRLVGDQLYEIFHAPVTYIALLDPQTDLIEFPYSLENGVQVHDAPIPAGRGLSSIVLRTRQPLLINQDTEQRSADLGAETIGSAAQSYLAVPIVAGEQALGLISLQHEAQAGLFGEADVRLLSTIAASVGAAIQNARLFAETQRRAQQLATAAEVSRASISLLNPDELIARTVELIRERFDLYYAGIFLVDPSGQWAVLHSATGEAGQALKARSHRLEVGGQSMVGAAVSQRQARVALDVGAEPVRFANPLLPDTRSELAVPLTVGQAVLGALDVQSTHPNAFSPADITVLQTMADQLATAIQNARLFAETQRRIGELALINRISQALTRQSDLPAQLAEVGELLLEYFRVPNGYIALYNAQTNLVEIPFFREGPERVNLPPFPLGEGVSSIIIRSRQPLLINHDAEKRLTELGARIVGKPARSFLGVPVIVGNDVIGVVNVQSTEQDGLFSEGDLSLLTTIAANLGSAIQTARLFAETRQRARQLATAAEVGRAAVSSLNVGQLLRQSVELVRERFGLYHAGLYLIEPGTDTAWLRAASGEAGSQLLARGQAVEVGSKSLVGAATFARQPVVVQDVARDPGHYASPLLPESRAQAVIPLLAGDAIIGALDVHSATAGSLGETDMAVLRTIADQLAAAVQNARLFDETRRLAGREQALNQLSGKLRGMLQIGAIAQVAVDELGRALQARRAVLQLGTEQQLLRRGQPAPDRDGNGAGEPGHNPNGHDEGRST